MPLCIRNLSVGLGIVFCLAAAALLPARMEAQEVRIWEEDLVLPTYLTGEPSIFPIFYNGRAYQGAQGRVYPYAFSDELTDECRDVAHKAVYLENRYIKLCVLPELGGRIFSAQDKSNGYDLFYRQTVVKPALIGMLGAWWSGGVEWNIPHHHRATSFMPMDYTLEENADGSKTVWVGELELRHRMTWAIGLTLYPDSSRIESRVRIMNRTPVAHSLLYWANVAVHTNEDYQVIFPPGTEYATYHGKNQFVHWPFAQESYNRMDYSGGVDISWWKNHPAPQSFFAWNCADDFLAGYDHAKKSGVIHVADRHVMPGKKFWTWGTAAQGRRWDTILSDDDGPYLELMVGAFSDNQPDYSWIEPYETRSVTHTWYPLREIGGVKAANLEAALNLDVLESTARIGINVSAPLKDAEASIWAGDRQVWTKVWKKELELAPDRPFYGEVELPEGGDPGKLRLELRSGDRIVLDYAPRDPEGRSRPREVEPPPAPEAVKTIEELYLAGLRLEQFHNPARDPIAYYQEALKRDPGDARVNTRMGIHYLMRGMADEAEAHLQRAVARLGWNHTRPKDGEALYYLGQALRRVGRSTEAVDALERAAWDPAWRTAAFTSRAQMACARGRFVEAQDFLDRSAPALKTAGAVHAPFRAAVLRHLGRLEEAKGEASAALKFNPLDFWAIHELALAQGAGGEGGAGKAEMLRQLRYLMRAEAQSWLELAADYMGCGLWAEAKAVLGQYLEDLREDKAVGAGRPPLILYTLGFLEQKTGDAAAARRYFAEASRSSPDGSFPFRAETVRVLEGALTEDPADSRAHYYLGTCLFENQPERALEHWERARELGEDNFMLFRNLGLAYARVRNDIQAAVSNMEEALAREKGHARLFYELDLMYASAGKDPEERLALLEENHSIVCLRDDTLTQEIKLLVQTGAYERAISLMSDHHFHVWEGGGQIHSYFVHAHLLRGCALSADGDFEEALGAFRKAGTYPLNLEVGEPYHGGRTTQVRYFEGTALEALGRAEEASEAYTDAAGFDRGWSDLSFYRGMALVRLGRGQEAREVFKGLAESAGQRLEAARDMDFFAKFGERHSAEARRAQSYFLLGLAELGLGNESEAGKALIQAAALDPSHFWARYYLDILQ